MRPEFPTVVWQPYDARATFIAADVPPPESRDSIFAVLVHAFFGDQMVFADIPGRGFCVPGGRLEKNETLDHAAVRESYEETGGRLHEHRRRLIGCTRLDPLKGGSASYVAIFIADVVHFDPIPEGSESKGFLLAAPESAADQYYMWDELLEAQFAYAVSQRTLLFSIGTPIALPNDNRP